MSDAVCSAWLAVLFSQGVMGVRSSCYAFRRRIVILIAMLAFLWFAVSAVVRSIQPDENGSPLLSGLSNLASPVQLTSDGTTITTSTASTTSTTTLPSFDSYIPLVLIFTQADKTSILTTKLIRCLRSIFTFATRPVNLIFISDRKSFDLAETVIKRNVTSDKAKLRISYLNLDDALYFSEDYITPIKQHFSSNNSYYSQTVFFLSVVMHQILPFHQRVLYVDIDTSFNVDIATLFAKFDEFATGHLVGIAFEQQPVYRHVLRHFRKSWPNTTLGSPPPHGQPGFNSGVVIFDLDQIRGNAKYLQSLEVASIAALTKKYSFQGHLGDQDLYTLLSFEHPEWFFILPCEWNRQLCVWWKNNGYSDVFSDYHHCSGSVQIYHGNCNTRIPTVLGQNATLPFVTEKDEGVSHFNRSEVR